MQVLRALFQHFFEPSKTRSEYPQQGEALQMSSMRAGFWAADQSGPPLEEARKRVS
ncbi:UNVERIFIED_CONTAM: hypothetical protein GTU68_022660, partial [Idotea baltica]|nr:hypothetical protein [Idotea baltica]